MHESALARQLLRVVIERAAASGSARVTRVSGWVAETETLSRESLELHFSAAARGTIAEGASLALELEHVRARCSACSTEYAPEHHVLSCPTCGDVGGELLGRTGIGIDSIDVRQ